MFGVNSKLIQSLCFIVCTFISMSQVYAAGGQKVEPKSLLQSKQGQSRQAGPTETIHKEEISPLAFQSLEQLDELVQLGMPALALRLLNQEQQKTRPFSRDWYGFEYKRIHLLSALGRWQGIVDRTQKLLTQAKPGKDIIPEISQWFLSQQALAWLKLDQPQQGLAIIRNLLWDMRINANPQAVAFWRRLIVRAYLLMNADNDAQIALLRYQQDYDAQNNHDGSDDPANEGDQSIDEDWKLLQARVLLRTQRAAEAKTLLSGLESVNAKALSLLATLQAQPKKAKSIIKQAEKEIIGQEISRHELWIWRYVIYQAHLKLKQPAKAAVVAERILGLGDTPTTLGEEFSVKGNDLWQLYEQVGAAAGNQYHLLVGDDAIWYDKAYAIQNKARIRALGLYTKVALHSRDAQKREFSHQEIVKILDTKATGLELINQMYLHSTRVSDIKSLPLSIRYRLVDYALSKSNLPLVARLMKSLNKPPEGEDAFAWHMRKARILVLQGNYDAGVKELKQTIAEVAARADVQEAEDKPEATDPKKADSAKAEPKKADPEKTDPKTASSQAMTPEQVDHYFQVIFDLQVVNQHPQVLELFALLKEDWLNDKLRRELYYWRAESHNAIEQHDQAAWLYLKSARTTSPTMSDFWAQSARFKAAQSLTQAGLYDDANTLFNDLLAVTASESKKKLIKQEIQHIQLLRNAEAKNNGRI